MNEQSRPTAENDRRPVVSRRLFLAAVPLTLSACVGAPLTPIRSLADARSDPQYLSMYGPVSGEPFPVPAIDLRRIDPQFYRRQVDFPTSERVGTIVVDPRQKFLYLVQDGGLAMRYGIGVGREGFGWSGRATIRRKAQWPKWTPPAEMVARDEKAAKWAGGMPGGIENPLGARALYLYEGGRDTLYRIHGTNEPWTIGSNVSSGCIRMLNQDAMDLYDRVPTGSEVLVLNDTPTSGRPGIFGSMV
ncbi:L,D-transpeptidase [Chthonobacter albigriseus]|uniref:L,D-transpeptidase n=1 Tax=Chthonobacter albigriseus TaxID=1683161 RepID=UPI0015EEBD56|nr:L,D-transpeptidase [Chthonobacter albigriseus]